MALDMRVNTSRVRNTVLVNSHGLMDPLTMVNSLITTSKVQENITGLTEENMTDFG